MILKIKTREEIIKEKDFYNKLYNILQMQIKYVEIIRKNAQKFNIIIYEYFGYDIGEKILSDIEFMDATVAYAENGEMVSQKTIIKELKKSLKKVLGGGK